MRGGERAYIYICLGYDIYGVFFLFFSGGSYECLHLGNLVSFLLVSKKRDEQRNKRIANQTLNPSETV